MKIKTFTQSLEIFRTAGELGDLDQKVNDFLESGDAKVLLGQYMDGVADYKDGVTEAENAIK